jgi:hypothetical protein
MTLNLGMPTCDKCGADIEFRYVGGRCVPIHPDGGWQCGSLSGHSSDDIHTRRSSGPREWATHDFCRPTSCPECGRNVFFIRHNDGSVWLDDLGWPWPKHACFDNPRTATTAFSRWAIKASGLTKPKLGLVCCIRPSQSGQEKFIEVELRDHTKIGFFLAWTPSNDSLLGSLVCISLQDKLLIHESLGEIAFTGLVEITSASAGNNVIQCKRCGSFIIAKNKAKHDQHCP